MTFDTYIINLDKDKQKFNKLSSSLSSKNINHKRFSAIYGKDMGNTYDKYIVKHKSFVPKNILGCSLSHYFVCKQHFDNSDNPAFILEDDAVLLFKNKNDIDNVIINAPPDWDIILLYAQGMTNYKKNTWDTTFFTFSSIGYIINRNGYNKWYPTNFKIRGHNDLTRLIKKFDGTGLKMYKTPIMMIKPDDTNISSTSTNYKHMIKNIDDILDNYFYDALETDVTNFKASQILKYKILRVPYIDFDIDSLMIVCILILFYIILKYA